MIVVIFKGKQEIFIIDLNVISKKRLALEIFVPRFGIALGVFSAFSTGLVFNAISQTSISVALHHVSPPTVFLIPFGILEVIAYGIAISRSGILA